jgi:copper(I)-binding protein
MKKWLFWAVLLAFALLLSGCAPNSADSAECGDLPASGPRIKISGAWARTAPSVNSAAYMVISNCSSEAETLLSVQSDAADMAALHKTTMNGDMATMSEVKQIDIPAGKKVELKSGDLHVMLMGIKQEIKAGDVVNLTLMFSKAGAIKVSAPARAP